MDSVRTNCGGRSFGSEMEAYNNRKGGVYLLAFLAVLILSAYCCSSAVLVESNSTPPCNGECQLLEDDMNPYIRRRLYDGFTNNALTASLAALPPCRPGGPYCTQKCDRPNSYFRGNQCQ